MAYLGQPPFQEFTSVPTKDSFTGDGSTTGFTLSGSNDVVFLTDIPNKNADGSLDGSGKGVLSVIARNQKDELRVVAKSAGTVDYLKGEIILNTLNGLIIQ